MGKRLDGKVAIVTGAGSRTDEIGNGRATALTFARERAKVIVNDRDEYAAEKTRAMILEAGGEAEIFVGDLTQADTAAELIRFTEEQFGKVDIVHNNIGIEGAGNVVDTDETFWDRVWEVNVKTMMQMAKFAIPAMERNGGGSMINISSISAIRPRGLTPYTVSKGAVNALTTALAVDHAAAHIRVNCIMPGPVYSAMVAGEMDEETRERRRLASPMKLEGTPWDIANAALFFASDESRWVTGQVIAVDGGVTISSPSR